jgi:molecular chaperone IbpA
MLLDQEDVAMTNLDFSPLFRSTIGFDRLFNVAEAATRADVGYPPYNIEVTGEDAYRVTVAVAGFAPDELDITVKENTLLVSGQAKTKEETKQALYRGIARRAFERRFQLADHIKVKGATVENGLLNIDLVREVPEEKKPRRIEIAVGGTTPLAVEQKAA